MNDQSGPDALSALMLLVTDAIAAQFPIVDPNNIDTAAEAVMEVLLRAPELLKALADG